jgi:excisionase family DNA binding protein
MRTGMPNGDDDLDTLDIATVCSRTGLGRSYVYEAIRRGELRARKYGRRTLVLRRDYQSWLEAAPPIGLAIGHDGAAPLALVTGRRTRSRAPQ